MAIVCYWLLEQGKALVLTLNTVCLEIQVARLQEATFFSFLLGRKLTVSPEIVEESRLWGFLLFIPFLVLTHSHKHI